MKNTLYIKLHNKYEIDNLIRASFKKLHPNDTFVEPAWFDDTKSWNTTTKRYENRGHSCKYWGKYAKYNNIWPETATKGKKLNLNIELSDNYRYYDDRGRPLKRPVPAISKGIRIYS